VTALEIVAKFARMFAPRGLRYDDARSAVAREGVQVGGVDEVTLQQACAEIGDEWAAVAYEAERERVTQSWDGDVTAAARETTVDELIAQLTSIRDETTGAGSLRVVYSLAYLDVEGVRVERPNGHGMYYVVLV